MSPIVPTRTVSAMRSVETPRSAATPALGRMRTSVRSRGAVDITLARWGTPAASRWSWAAVSATTARSGPATISVTSRWPFSRSAQNRMSGTCRRMSETLVSICFCVRWRSFFGVRLMVRLANRTSFLDGSCRPPSTNTLRTSGRARMRSTRPSVTRVVSARRAPGGSSTTKMVREASSAGRKPEGSRLVDQIETAKQARPRTSVTYLWRTDQATIRV